MSNAPKDHPLRKTFVEKLAESRQAAPPAATRPAQSPLPSSIPRSEEVAVGKPSAVGPPDLTEVEPARPVHRPPMAVLWIFDDGEKTADLVRIRSSTFVIGRTEGDVIVEHDSQISSRHAEIARVLQDGQYRWYLRDLQSTNGTFARVREAVLKNDAEIMIARDRFRFVVASSSDPQKQEAPNGVPDIRQTCTWRTAEVTSGPPGRPCLVELHASDEGKRFPLTVDSLLIGRDSRQCQIVLGNRNVDLHHAKVHRDDHDRWHVEDLGSRNGLWLRVTEIPLMGQSAFLLGEQMFAFAFP